MAKATKSQPKKPTDLTKAKKKTDVELKEEELGRVTGGAFDTYLKLDQKQ